MENDPKLELLKIDLIDIQEDNPNEMSDDEFNRLVQSIEEDGFEEPLVVCLSSKKGRYELISGHHRLRAARIIGYTELPCMVHPELPEDRIKAKVVKANILHGKMNPAKFTAMVNDLMGKGYEEELLRDMMGFTDEAEFGKLYQEVKQGLSPELQKKLEESKAEIKTIDDLSRVLNKLFQEHGETVPLNYIVFSYGGSRHAWVAADKKLWGIIVQMTKQAETENRDINDILLERLASE
jgi:ParB-like chromosome segregation protein Spo0J